MREPTTATNTRRLLPLATLGAATTLVLAACGGGDGGGLDEASGLGGDRPTITFAAAMFAESGRGPLLEEFIEDFNDSQDQVYVEPATVPFSSFGATIFTQMGGGEGPDVIRFDHTDFYAAADAELLLPFDELIDTSGYDFLPPDEHNFYDGVRYAIAFEISNYALLYNPDLVDDVPGSIEEFIDATQAATEGDVYGFAYRTTMPEQAGMWFDICNFVYGLGGDWTDADGNPTFNSLEVVEAVELFAEVHENGVTPEGADAATYRRMFAEGKVAMMIDNGGVPPIVLGQNPDAPIEAAPAPFPSGVQGQVITPLGVNANTDHPELVALFLEWLLEEENQAALQDVLGASSPALAVERSAEQLEELPFADVYDAATETGRPFIVRGLEVETPELRQTVVDAVIRVLQGQTDAQSAMDEVQSRAESLTAP